MKKAHRNVSGRYIIVIIVIGIVLLLEKEFYLDPQLDRHMLLVGVKNTESPRGVLASSSAVAQPAANASLYVSETRFTPHVREVLSEIKGAGLSAYWPEKFCLASVRFFVDRPYTAPSRIECKQPTRSEYLCPFFQQIFASKATILPYNTSIGISLADFNEKQQGNKSFWRNCIASSSPHGSFAMTNFQDMKTQALESTPNKKKKKQKKNFYDYDHHQPTLPWEDRQTIPVFRGHPRIPNRKQWKQTGCPSDVTKIGHRLEAADFSARHPQLLNAGVRYRNGQCKHICCTLNQTHEMDRLFVPPNIPPEEYYSNYQTVLVLGGIGAAFRTRTHLRAGQAVVLQAFSYEEWFVSYMEPYTHYIPLQQDLSDLKEVMEWVRDHPKKVKQIAEQGNRFYQDYLSFQPTEQHWHELLWRLSLMTHETGPDRLKFAKGRGIWPAPIVPTGFERGPNGDWQEIDVHTKLAAEDDAIAGLSMTNLAYLPGQWQGGVAWNKTEMRDTGRGWVGT